MDFDSYIAMLRKEEYPMLKDNTYLDHAGTTLYATSLVQSFGEDLCNHLYGNPHSLSSPARRSQEVVESVRRAALSFFQADPEEFDLVFVANATAGIKLVADSFRDLSEASKHGRFWYGYHKDAHTSLVGVRELAGQHHCFSSDDEVESWLRNGFGTPEDMLALFAYPGQSNMTGRRLPLNWCHRLRQSPISVHQNTYSLLDAAALATTSQIDLSNSEKAPDFTVVSFYKIFGLPDLGALIIRKASGHILTWRRYFGGGTILQATVLSQPSYERKTITLHESLEDGTLPFHNIILLQHAIATHVRLYGSMRQISTHTSSLIYRLFVQLHSLQYPNGRPVCQIYHSYNRPHDGFHDATRQGPTIAFNVLRQDSTLIGYHDVEQLADEAGIYVRSGGLCNPGGIASHLGFQPWQFQRAWSAGHRCSGGSATDIICGKPMGVVRVSLGAMSTQKDVDTFIAFIHETFVKIKIEPESPVAVPKIMDSTETFAEPNPDFSQRGITPTASDTVSTVEPMKTLIMPDVWSKQCTILQTS